METSLPEFDHVSEFRQRLNRSGWWHSFELPNGEAIEGACDLAGLKGRIAQFPIPDDLRGKRVLDIGAWDGWFSFEMERRGASVVAIDTWDNPRFRYVHQVLDSKVEYLRLDVYDLDPRTIGRFDIVLFMGVLYHLKHPLLALEKVCSVTTDIAAVDSFVLQEKYLPDNSVEIRPVMEFYETAEFGGQTDNWVAPSLPCMLAFCRTAGFARVELQSLLDFSACVACYRDWKPAEIAGTLKPTLLSAFHHLTFGINFNSAKDEYVTCEFECDTADSELALDRIRPRVGPYGVRPIHISRSEKSWKVQFKCPPGLERGWHEVTLSVDDGPRSNAVEIAVDLDLETSRIEILSAADGSTWQPQVAPMSGGVVAVWVEGLPAAADRHNLTASVSGFPCPVEYVERKKGGARQVNIAIPEGAWPGGGLEIRLAVGAVTSNPHYLPILKG